MRIWHPEVHGLFGERLHYYLLTFRPFKVEDFKIKIEAFRSQQGIGGFYWYEVFGGFDVILRVWVPSDHENNFADLLREKIPEIERVIPFKVTHISRYWLAEDELKCSQKDVLNQVTVERVRNIQTGKSPEQVETFVKAKLLAEVEQSRNLRFFVVLSNPQAVTRAAEERFHKELTDTIDKYKSSQNQLSRASIYFGYGFAWALIKAETTPDNFFIIGKIVNDLNQALQGFGFFTTTYLTTGPNFFECDDISNSSLTLAGGFDLAVARLLPSFYKLEVEEDLRSQIIRWVKDARDLEKLPDQHKELIARALLGVIAQNEKAVLSPLQEYFVDNERYLRAKWPQYVNRQVGGKKTPEVLRAVGIPEGANLKFFALGDMCNILAEVIRRTQPDKKELIGGWQHVANLRNIVAHGACEPLRDWPEMLKVLILSFFKLDLLKATIDTQPAGHERTLSERQDASPVEQTE